MLANLLTLLNLITNILNKLQKAEKATVLYINKPESGLRSKRRGIKGRRSRSSSNIKYIYYKKPGY